MAQFICGGEKYERGGKNLDTIGLSVKPEGLPTSVEAGGYTLNLKTAFHVTLVAIGKIIEKYKVADPEFKQKVLDDFCEFVKNNPIDLLRYRDGYRFTSQDERRTVVVMVDVSNLNKFFALLNKKYNLKLEYPPTHVTLYTLQPDIGIFMTNAEDLARLSKLIPSPVSL